MQKNEPLIDDKKAEPKFDNGLPSSLPPEIQALIDKNLLEVFNFYCRKFINQKGGEFDKLDKNLILLGLNGYNRFCKDFKVPLDNQGITLAWKKASNNHMPHEFEQF